MNRVQILNAALDPLTLEQSVDVVFDALAAGRRGWVSTLNVSMLIGMRRQARLQVFADNALLAVADGQPLVWVAPLFGGRLPERVAGIDLMDRLCARAAHQGTPVYLLGARPDVLERALHALRIRHPGLEAHGADGYFEAKDASARAAVIRASGAGLVFVGMGSPRQEAFIEEQLPHLGAVVAIGVGGSFDVAGGVLRRAPPWVGKAGLEWLFRLVQEPRRLLPRYACTNALFLLLIVQTLLRGHHRG